MRFVLAVALSGLVLGVVAVNWVSMGFFAICTVSSIVAIKRERQND